MKRVRLLTASGLALLLALSLLAPAAGADRKRKVRLKAFSSCTNLVQYGTRHLDRVTGGGGSPPPMARPAPAPGGAQEQADAPAAAPAPASGTDSSTTNVQEVGIDEPDIVKSDGQTIFALREGVLHAVDARAETPVRLGSLTLPGRGHDHRLLIHGGKALIVHTDYADPGQPEPQPDSARPASTPAYYPGEPKTVLTEVDVSDPSAMKVVRTLDAQGAFVSSRLTGRTARLVLRAVPQAVYREQEGRRVRRWLPRGTLHDRRTGDRDRSRLVECRSVRRPSRFSGLDTVTVLTVDMEKGLPAVDSDAIMADAETVYASHGSLYVASQRWVRALEQPTSSTPPIPDGLTTLIHRFDVSEPGQTVYRSSGAVTGFLLNQFSLSEHEGVLRVASTNHPTWWGGTGESESSVTVLDGRDGLLRRIGSVDGLGKGERIYAVRFIGDVGYVVTFRQIDPLYTIDLSDPANPRVLGELKITGYSAYLHPAGDGRLIGVGREATEEGRTLGVQVSLFDVSDLRDPRLLDKRMIGGQYSSTAVEWDHHAFLWWPDTELAVLPLDDYDEQGQTFGGAVGLRVSPSAIAEAGRITHPAQTEAEFEWRPHIERSLVVGERLFTLSPLGLKASRLDDLSDVAFVPL